MPYKVVIEVFCLCIPIILEQTMVEIQSSSSNTIPLKVRFSWRLFTLVLHRIDCKLWRLVILKWRLIFFPHNNLSYCLFDSIRCEQILEYKYYFEKMHPVVWIIFYKGAFVKCLLNANWFGCTVSVFDMIKIQMAVFDS